MIMLKYVEKKKGGDEQVNDPSSSSSRNTYLYESSEA